MRARGRERGQTLVEFALIMPIFLLGVFGLIDGSRLVYMSSTLSQAAREGARQGSVEASWISSAEGSCGATGGPICPADVDTFEAHVVAAVNRMMVPFGSVPSASVAIRCDATTPPSGDWTGQSCSSPTSGGVVSVRVKYTFMALTPVVGQILGTLSLSGSATMVMD